MLEVNNKADLTKQISQYKRVLALFSSSWCPFCQRFAKSFDANVGNCKVDLVLRVNMDDYDSPLWDEYNVDAVPTLILFENGEIKSRLDAGSGTGLNEKQFTSWLKTINPQ
ncbi:MAG: thioredoxin family protein [Candidatus Bathyarchaeia archaeon]|jgi:thiol-disulfide isomerase/thioredoxin